MLEPLSPFKIAHDGHVITLRQGIYTIGRGPSCDLVLSDGQLSRQHAALHVSTDRLVVEDLSRNGLLVNGRIVTGEQELAPGDLLKLGKHTVVVLRDDPRQPTADTEERPVRSEWLPDKDKP